MSGAILTASAIVGGALVGTSYLQSQAQSKASKAQSDAQAKALALQQDQASKAEQEQNRVNKQTVNANAILDSVTDYTAYGYLTGGQGVNGSLPLGGNTLLGDKDLLG